MIHVRKASLLDLSDLVAWGKTQHPRANDGVAFNAVWFRNVLKAAMTDASQCVYLAKHDGHVCGLLIGIAMPMLWSPLLCATDQVFVAERGGAQLLDAFFAWCKKLKVRRIDMGVSTADDPRIDRFYRMRGMTRAGGMYFKQFGGGQ